MASASKKIVKKEIPIQTKKENQPIPVMKDNVKEVNEDDDNQPQPQPSQKIQNQDFDAYEFYKTYDPTKNKFNNVLSLYEFTSCLGLRATQISEGCPVLIDVPEGMENPEEIALLEIKAGK